MNELDIKINGLLNELETAGDEKDELEYWRSILEFLSTEQKKELVAILEAETLELKNVSDKNLSDEDKLKLQNAVNIIQKAKTLAKENEKSAVRDYEQKQLQRLREKLSLQE